MLRTNRQFLRRDAILAAISPCVNERYKYDWTIPAFSKDDKFLLCCGYISRHSDQYIPKVIIVSFRFDIDLFTFWVDVPSKFAHSAQNHDEAICGRMRIQSSH